MSSDGDEDDLVATTIAFLAERGWSWERVDGVPELRFLFEGASGLTWPCFVHVEVDDQQWLFFSEVPGVIPPRDRQAVMTFLTRANFGMSIGNFEMDLDDGTVRFKTSIDARGVALTAGLVRNHVDANLGAMDVYLPGVLEVLAGTSPEAAIASIEH
jgi:hypothetical protein